MSAQEHAPVPQQFSASLAKEFSVQLDDGMPLLFGGKSRGSSGLPASFRGAFPRGAVNEYGSQSTDDGELQLEKWTSISNIVPVGVLLDKHDSGPSEPAPPTTQRQFLSEFGQRLHQQKQKQGSQQRGPGRPESKQQEKKIGSPDSKRRCGSEPHPSAQPSLQRESSGAAVLATPVAIVASNAADDGSIPLAVKKPVKFKVKLNGRVVASTGGAATSLSPALRNTPPETNTIVDTMCGLGAQLLSPLPSHWGLIVDAGAATTTPDSTSAQPAVADGTSQPQQVPSKPDSSAADRSTTAGQGAQMAGAQVQRRQASGPSEMGPMGSPFAAAAQQHAQPSSPQLVQPLSDDPQPAAPPSSTAVLGGQPVLSPVPSAWGQLLKSPDSSPAAQAAGQSTQQEAAGRQQDDAPRAPSRAGKRNRESRDVSQQPEQQQHGRAQDSGAAAAAARLTVPAAKQPRSAGAEPSGERQHEQPRAIAATHVALQKRMGSCELPTAAASELPPRAASACAMARPTAPVEQVAASAAKRPPLGPVPRRDGVHGSATSGAPASAKEDRGRHQPQLQERPAESGGRGPLEAVAAPLQAALQAAADQGCQAPSSIMQLQDEGRRLKRFAEKRMAGERHTHVSCTFLLSSGLKFLSAAGIMEGAPHKYSRDSASTMYSQTAAMLESCAHASMRADGPPLGTQVVALLAERLGAVARLRAAHCLRNELNRDAAAFRTAVEGARGETFQRPSPSDSNVSATLSIPLEGGSPVEGNGAQHAGGRKKGQAQGGGGSAAPSPSRRGGTSGPPAAAVTSGKKGSAGAAATGGKVEETASAAPSGSAVPLLGLPRGIVDRELGMATHMQAIMAALSALGRSSERLREYMASAATEGNVHALRAAAGAALLSTDAGMGTIDSLLAIGREALDAAMKIEA